jgi:dihydrofolate reductase
MKLSIVVAISTNGVIGRNNQLPWYLPADLKHFRKLTTGKPILMGRKTWESIGRPLPERKSIVITRDRDYTAAGAVVVTSIEAALKAAEPADEIMIIGGSELFREMLREVSTIYLTRVHADIEGTVFFPELDEREWREVDRTDCEPDERNAYAYSFITLERVN